MSTGTISSSRPDAALPRFAAQATRPAPQSASALNASNQGDTVLFTGGQNGPRKKKLGQRLGLLGAGLALAGGSAFGFHQLAQNWGAWWPDKGDIAEFVINNAIRYPLGDGLIKLSKLGSTIDTEHYMLNGMKVEGRLSDSAELPGKFGGYADLLTEENMYQFIQNTPLEQRVYLDPADEANVRKIDDVHERLSVELNVLDGTLQTVDYNGAQRIVLAIQDQTGEKGDYAVQILEVPPEVGNPATLQQNLPQIQEWAKRAITEYKSFNAGPGGK